LPEESTKTVPTPGTAAVEILVPAAAGAAAAGAAAGVEAVELDAEPEDELVLVDLLLEPHPAASTASRGRTSTAGDFRTVTPSDRSAPTIQTAT
jgi:hypothetical protein